MAYVADDPDQLFKVAVTGGATSTTITPISGAIVGDNLAISQPSTNTTISGNSNIGVYDSGSNTAASLPFRVIDLVLETTNSAGNYSEVIVKWNAPHMVSTTTSDGATPPVFTTTTVVTGGHSYLNPTGNASV
jgi:hypothetical protein